MSTYKYQFSKNFERKSSKLFRKDHSLRKRFYKTLIKILEDPFYKGLRTHKVNTSKWGEVNSSRVTKDIRILWDFGKESITIIVIDIGGHEGSAGVY
jgi:mRNA-degrading endonuclease YafQ of YafQ-DinJ toxin-antitoxin module